VLRPAQESCREGRGVNVLVTGGAGFIGSHVVDLLVSEAHDVAVVDNLVTGKISNLNPQARFHRVDICSPDIEAVFRAERPEVVFHLAAQMSVKASTDNPRYDAEVNVLGLVNLLDACVATQVRKVVFASSGATYGNPHHLPLDENHPQWPESPYGISKMAGEHYLSYYARDRGLKYTVLRYGNVYGPRQDAHGEAGVVAIFTRQLLAGQTPMIHSDGEQVRDYVYVADVAAANLAAASAGDGRCYCIGTGVGTSVNQLYKLVSETLDVAIAPQRGPRRAGDLRAAYFDVRRARDELGWEPLVPLQEGVLRTAESFRGAMTESRTNDAGVPQ
jgi:UDP-glucose 4-epimerase